MKVFCKTIIFLVSFVFAMSCSSNEVQFQSGKLNILYFDLSNDSDYNYTGDNANSKKQRFEVEDTLHSRYYWGTEEKIVLGVIYIDSILYEVSTITRNIEVADGIKSNHILSFVSSTESFEYDMDESSYYHRIKVNEGYVVTFSEQGNSCKELILSFDELLCFDCIDECFIRR